MRAKLHKNKFKFHCYFQGGWDWLKPSFLLAKKLERLKDTLATGGPSLMDEIEKRSQYYHSMHESFCLPDDATPLSAFSPGGSWAYFLDYKRHFRYFPQHFRVSYIPGDVIHVPETPSLLKSRPISENNQNSILLKLNRLRHYYFYPDTTPFEKKENYLVWRGKCHEHLHRLSFLEAFYDHPSMNVGDSHKKAKNRPWYRDFLSIPEQLQAKFILSIEGKDVATNLKWIMASNSLCFMTRPKFETWFMEGRLKPNVHYVEIKPDYSDIEDKLDYYMTHTNEALQIIRNANHYVEQFLNSDLEDLIMLRVLGRYFKASGQVDSTILRHSPLAYFFGG